MAASAKRRPSLATCSRLAAWTSKSFKSSQRRTISSGAPFGELGAKESSVPKARGLEKIRSRFGDSNSPEMSMRAKNAETEKFGTHERETPIFRLKTAALSSVPNALARMLGTHVAQLRQARICEPRDG